MPVYAGLPGARFLRLAGSRSSPSAHARPVGFFWGARREFFGSRREIVSMVGSFVSDKSGVGRFGRTKRCADYRFALAFFGGVMEIGIMLRILFLGRFLVGIEGVLEIDTIGLWKHNVGGAASEFTKIVRMYILNNSFNSCIVITIR